MKFTAALAVAMIVSAPAFANDDLLKFIMARPGVDPVDVGDAATDERYAHDIAKEEPLSMTMDTPADDGSGTGPNAPGYDPNFYDYGEQWSPDGNSPEWQSWYLQSLGNPDIPAGMTTDEFIKRSEFGDPVSSGE